jgi:hypothetical protein
MVKILKNGKNLDMQLLVSDELMNISYNSSHNTNCMVGCSIGKVIGDWVVVLEVMTLM